MVSSLRQLDKISLFEPLSPVKGIFRLQEILLPAIELPTMNDMAQKTLDLLRNRSAQVMLKQISADTSISYYWLCKFHQGKIDDKYKVSDNKIQKLHEYLVSKVNV